MSDINRMNHKFSDEKPERDSTPDWQKMPLTMPFGERKITIFIDKHAVRLFKAMAQKEGIADALIWAQDNDFLMRDQTEIHN